jgi:hypothetical protein
LADKPEAKQVIDRMVNEIVDILKKHEYESKMNGDDDDDWDDDDDLDDIDLSSLGF